MVKDFWICVTRPKKVFELEASAIPEEVNTMIASAPAPAPAPVLLELVSEEEKNVPSADMIPLSDVLDSESEVYRILTESGYQYAMQVLNSSNKQLATKTHLSKDIVQQVKNVVSEFMEKWKA